MEKIPNFTSNGKKYPIVPLVEENIQLNLFLKQKPPKCTSYGRKHPVVLLMTENTQSSIKTLIHVHVNYNIYNIENS
jgi:hypothetical protein